PAFVLLRTSASHLRELCPSPPRRSSDLDRPSRLPALTLAARSGGNTCKTTATLQPGVRSCFADEPRTLCVKKFSQSGAGHASAVDRKSTRLNSSHQVISYAVLRSQKKKQ